ncbi:MAG: DNA repair protein RadA [Candidatus Omnitrophica bacterium]|nr:DNA repair protein RadA [Candidatus Omnitrophota bacterium]MBU1871840.1 DNA repair protein RadA [Candidatus Omnitrophota bacterium]
MKTKTVFACQSCGYQSVKWLGRCPDCNNWNSFVEETYAAPSVKGKKSLSTVFRDEPVLLRDITSEGVERVTIGIEELDNVLGGGIVPGSVILIGGDPGIGKSTISLQVCSKLTEKKIPVLYISGEESTRQTKMRADRLGAGSSIGGDNLYIVSQTDLSLIIEYIDKIKPQVVFIDSIQVLFSDEISSSAGSISQVRECASRLTLLAKSRGISLFIIGHVTKEGTLAGPRVLEHMVDTVLYFEGDRFSMYRVLRAVKNRFGSVNEIGVFEMSSAGLKEVGNPSQMFLSQRPKEASGTVVVSVMEGSRPLFVEIQALVSHSGFGYARRRSQGFDFNRMSLLVAVLEKRMDLRLENEDIFVNVVGGIKIEDPAADLGVSIAIASAFKDKPVLADSLILGEVGLTGEIRSILQAELRINEAQKLGFKSCVLPEWNFMRLDNKSKDLELKPVSSLRESLNIILRKEK